MENAQKAIMIGVGLFITIIIIAAVMLITGMGQNLLNQGQSQVNGISESLRNELFEQYNGKKLSGAQVRTAATQLVNRDDASSITVKILDGNGSESVCKSTSDVNTAIGTRAATQFWGHVTQDANKGTVEVTWNLTK